MRTVHDIVYHNVHDYHIGEMQILICWICSTASYVQCSRICHSYIYSDRVQCSTLCSTLCSILCSCFATFSLAVITFVGARQMYTWPFVTFNTCKMADGSGVEPESAQQMVRQGICTAPSAPSGIEPTLFTALLLHCCCTAAALLHNREPAWGHLLHCLQVRFTASVSGLRYVITSKWSTQSSEHSYMYMPQYARVCHSMSQ